MIYFLNFTASTLREIGILISTNNPINKLRLLKTYLKLKIKYLLLQKMLNIKQENVNILGYEVKIYDLDPIIRLFEEIFINLDYYFQCPKKRPVIIDCGSHLGISLIFFKHLYPKSKIYAFEPNPDAFVALQNTIEANKLNNIFLSNKALDSKVGIKKLYLQPSDPASGRESLRKGRASQEYTQVPTTILSSFVSREINFLKIDIEGTESQVIKDLDKSNKLRKINAITIEYHHHMQKDQDSFSNILKVLEDNNFGYQLNAYCSPRFGRGKFQDILISAYRK